MKPPGARTVLDGLCALLGLDPLTLQELFRSHLHVGRLFGYWTWAPAALVALVACILGGLYAPRVPDRCRTGALAIYALLPMALAFVFSRIANSMYVNRSFLGSCALLPILLAAPVAFQPKNSSKVFRALGVLVLAGVVVSANGYLHRERKQDWRGTTDYLVGLRLIVVVPDIALPLGHFYAGQFSKQNKPLSLTGLVTRFDPPDVDFEKRTLAPIDDPNFDVLALLSHEMSSGKYKEIDVVLLHDPFIEGLLIAPTLRYLAAHCTSIQIKEFYGLEVRQCSPLEQEILPSLR
jgi:hypothetical protein